MVITQLNIPSPKKGPQKASDSLSNLRIDKTNVDGALGTTFEQVLYIRYPTTFWEKSVSALLDSRSEFNTIHPTFAKELGLSIRPIAPWNVFQRQGTENWRHHARYLWNGSRSFLGD